MRFGTIIFLYFGICLFVAAAVALLYTLYGGIKLNSEVRGTHDAYDLH